MKIATVGSLAKQVDLRASAYVKMLALGNKFKALISAINWLKSLIHCCRLSNISISSLL